MREDDGRKAVGVAKKAIAPSPVHEGRLKWRTKIYLAVVGWYRWTSIEEGTLTYKCRERHRSFCDRSTSTNCTRNLEDSRKDIIYERNLNYVRIRRVSEVIDLTFRTR